MNLKYLVLSSHDERYDFNFEFTTTNLEPDKYIEVERDRHKDEFEIENVNGITKYSCIETYTPDPLSTGLDKSIVDKLEVIVWAIVYFIPIELIISGNLYALDGFIGKNLKFGMLDLKGG